jgi:hypothetical protein
MKFYTLDKTILMDITAVGPHDQGVVIEGKIMGTMPMKVVLRPAELRAGLKLVTPQLIWQLIRMLFQRASK